jgi:hypothetical protein
MLGNTSVTSVRASGSFIIMSDGRFKDNRKENVPGLDFIKELKPVTYNYNIHRLNDYLKTEKHKSEIGKSVNCCSMEEEEAIIKRKKSCTPVLIAQEVETAGR